MLMSKCQSGTGLFFCRGLKMIRKHRMASRKTRYSSGLTSLGLKVLVLGALRSAISLHQSSVASLTWQTLVWETQCQGTEQSPGVHCLLMKLGLCWESSAIHWTPGYRARKLVSSLLNTTIKISEEFKIVPSKEKGYTLENS